MSYRVVNYFDKDDSPGVMMPFTINGYSLIVGKNVVIGENFSLKGDKNLTTYIGQDTYIGNNVTLESGIQIGKRNTILEECSINSSTPDNIVITKNGQVTSIEEYIDRNIKRAVPLNNKINIALAADDFGRTNEANEGIEYYLNKDVLNHTSLMINRLTAKDAIDYIHKNKIEDKIGIHFNITEVENKYSVNVEGNFANRLMTNKKNQICLSKTDKCIVKEEIKNQLDSFLSYDLKLNYFDSHGHVHFIPSISNAIIPVLKNYNVKSTRIPMHNFGKLSFKKRLYELIFKRHITKKYSRNFVHFDYFIRAIDLFKLDDKFIGKTVEVMTHPFAYGDKRVNRRDIDFNCIFGFIIDNSDKFNLI